MRMGKLMLNSEAELEFERIKRKAIYKDYDTKLKDFKDIARKYEWKTNYIYDMPTIYCNDRQTIKKEIHTSFNAHSTSFWSSTTVKVKYDLDNSYVYAYGISSKIKLGNSKMFLSSQRKV